MLLYKFILEIKKKVYFSFQTKYLNNFLPRFFLLFNCFYQTDLSISGFLEVSLNYIKPQSLLLTIHSAEGLSKRKDGLAAQAMVKCSIPGSGLEVYKTQVSVMMCKNLSQIDNQFHLFSLRLIFMFYYLPAVKCYLQFL